MADSLENCKITGYAVSIKNLPDKIENQADWLKAQFDARTDEEVKQQHNALCELLKALGVEESVTSEDIRGIRVGALGSLEWKDAQGAWHSLGTGGGVASFAGRAGAVEPQAGDYTAADVGAYTKEETDEKLDEADAGVRAAIPAPNLGDNPNFLCPVNQRGQASYTGDASTPYCIDRWRLANGTTYNVAAHMLIAESYAARACGMIQPNLLAEDGLSVGDTLTVSLFANGQLHTASMPILDRSQYSAFTDVPAGYSCDDFEITLCTIANNDEGYNLGIYPKTALTIDYIKWEKGDVATPWQPKDFGAELTECLRYYQQITVDWRTYPAIADVPYRINQSALQRMRLANPTITKNASEPYVFGCAINAMAAYATAIAVEVTITQQGASSGAASLLGQFNVSADL